MLESHPTILIALALIVLSSAAIHAGQTPLPIAGQSWQQAAFGVADRDAVTFAIEQDPEHGPSLVTGPPADQTCPGSLAGSGLVVFEQERLVLQGGH